MTQDAKTVQWSIAACMECNEPDSAATVLREAIAEGLVTAQEAADIRADVREAYGAELSHD